jgi:gliding motility-associated-like protein
MEIITKFKDAEIYVPTAFTPNNDGLNDYFDFTANPGIKINYFRIYNRWGQLVYTNTQNKTGWDGTYKGISQPTGIYPWILQAINAHGKTIQLNGTVVLIR